MSADETLQKIYKRLNLEQWEEERKPIYIADLRAILDNLNKQPENYPGNVRKDLEDLIRTFEDPKFLRDLGYSNSYKLGHKLEAWGIIPKDDGSDRRKTEDQGYTDDGVIKKTKQEINGILPD